MRTIVLFLILGAAGWQTIDFNGLYYSQLEQRQAQQAAEAPPAGEA